MDREPSNRGGAIMKEPNGIDLLATLIHLLADQEGAIITYELVDDFGNVRKGCTTASPTGHPNPQ